MYLTGDGRLTKSLSFCQKVALFKAVFGLYYDSRDFRRRFTPAGFTTTHTQNFFCRRCFFFKRNSNHLL